MTHKPEPHYSELRDELDRRDEIINSYKNLLADERAEVERLKPLAHRGTAMKWRPIEEAPKDGTWVLAYWKTNVFMMSRWFESENKWSDNNGYPMKDQPTHFIPLSALGEPET